jgi:hypothetical protein
MHFPLLLDFFQLPGEFETGIVLVTGSFLKINYRVESISAVVD